ncbi:m28 family peptidase, partial [Cystoisospora suis]
HLAVGAHQNGSGVAAVLELARILSRLYGEGDEAAEEDKDPANTKKRNFGSPNRRGKYSFLFLLTDAGASDFAGASAFLNQLEPTLLQSIQYVLCLDDLIPSSSSSSTVMYLHTAKKYKNAHVQTLLSLLENFLKKNGIDSFVLKPRKIVVQQAPLKPRRQHEHFTMRKLISGTLSAKSDEEAKENLWTRSSLIDSQPLDEESEKAFTAVTTAVAETLASLTYSLDDKEDRKEQGGERHEKEQKGEVEEVEIIRGSYGVSTAHLNAWVSLASKTPRFYAYQSLARSVKKSEGGGSIPFQEEIETSFRRSGLIPQTQTFSLEPFSNISFTYEPPLYMAVLETRPVFFDILLLLLSLAYCFSIYYTLAGWDLLLPGLTRLLNTASSLFSKGTSQMLKAAKGGTTGGDEE